MAKDRYQYFRLEARELLDALSRGVLELERAPADRGLVARLLRHAHTLKGAARVVQQPGIADLAHAAEDALGPHRDEASAPVPPQRIDALLRLVDEMGAGVAALEAPPGAQAEPAPAAGAAPPSLRVEVREVDALLASALEASARVTALRRGVARLEHAREVARALADGLAARRAEGGAAPVDRLRPLAEELRHALDGACAGLATGADAAQREAAQVRSAVDRLRLVPARDVFGALERAARDAARTLGREVAFDVAGGEVRLDASVLAALREALLHVVRNAVAHGIEPPSERAARGKPAAGSVRVEVERRGRRIAFTCRDDGRGVDVAAVREAAVRKGLLSDGEARALDAERVAAVLLRGGISTSASVNAVAGRGVGLDVVRDVASRLGAAVELRTAPGHGTTVELTVPASLTAVTALHVEAGGGPVAIPLDAVRHATWLRAGEVACTGAGAAIAHGGRLVPFAPLADVLRRDAPAVPRRAWSALLVAAGEELVAVGAERLLGTGEVVVRPLPACAEAAPVVAGAALDAEGRPRLVLDPAGLAGAVHALRGARPAAPAEQPRTPVLVVDDSLTSRMLQQSILESAGYDVELASSGEEGLEKAQARPFGAFLVDVEMPGMDGLEFVRVTRADPRLAAVPAVLVTSRGAPEDRRRGLDAGASAYIVKSEFDQARLLATLDELLR